MEKRLPMNLQFFASDSAGTEGTQGTQTQTQQAGQQQAAGSTPAQANTAPTAPEIDYDKLASIIQGKQSVTEDKVLKTYFEQQGLSPEEMKQAIATFKDQKAKNQPDISAMQQQIATNAKLAQEAAVRQAATMEAVTLGLNAKTIEYVLKLADLDGCMSDKGEADQEKIKAAINKVLEDVPALKPTENQGTGFRIGGNSDLAGSTQSQQAAGMQPKVATKRWNRFN